MNTRFSLVAACAAALLCQNALADTTAHAQLTNFNFQLIDLDLNDGITPSIRFTDSAPAYIGIQIDRDYMHEMHQYFTLDQPHSDGLQSATSQARTSFSGTGFFSDIVSDSMTTGAGVRNYSNIGSFFYITPMTRIVLSGDSQASLDIHGEGHTSAYLNTLATFGMPWSTEPTRYTNVLQTDQYSTDYSQQFNDHFELRVSNDSAEEIRGYMLLSTDLVVTVDGATVPDIPPAIPEPESWALMAGGLLALGAMVRRRRQGS